MSNDASTKVIHKGIDKQADEELTARLVEEMVQRWQAGERVSAEEFLTQHPELQTNPEAAIRLVYEEVCLRQERGEAVPPDEVLQRFPQWRAQLKVLLDCHRLLDAPPAPAMPAVADVQGEFILLAELGRGLQGRVYLASQPTLAERLVVLKITPRTGQEHLSLARLQHTHIMPLYAVQDDPKRNLRTLCMPYFGGASLHQVLEELRKVPFAQRTGQQLLEALDRAAARATDSPLLGQGPSGNEDGANSAQISPARQLFAGASYAQAICWIGTCLADALQYAHERGLVHLDLKPSNVLLAADGQPMLLDFHIAQKPIRPGDPFPEGLGGTLIYMSPEQRDVLTALRDGQPITQVVDGRSDIYSLGLSLYEALGGPVPLKDKQAVVPLSRCSPQVSLGLSDILCKSLAVNPQKRYPTAAALALDLRQHLRDLPLLGVRNRSLTERWGKWRRRHPHALTLAFMGICILAAVLSFAYFIVDRGIQQHRAAVTALAEGQHYLKKRAYAQAVDSFRRGAALAQNLPEGNDELASRLDGQLHLAQRGLAAEQLHAMVDRLRFLYGASTLPAGEASALASRWHSVWDKRTWLKDRCAGELDAEVEQRLDADLLDLGTIWADLCVRLAEPNKLPQAWREALQVLAETEALFGTSHVLCRQRQIYAKALGEDLLAEEAGRCAAERAPQTAWEYYALGRSLLQSGELEQAATALNKALKRQEHGFWPNFYQGICAYRQKHYADAVSAFRVCVALAPASAECYYNRALSEAALGRTEPALYDYDRALQLEPHFAAAALNRGILYLGQKRYPEALADLNHALAWGSDAATVHYNLALVYLVKNDRAAALSHLQTALKANPEYLAAQHLLDHLQRGKQKQQPRKK